MNTRGGHGHDTGAVIRTSVFVGKADLPLIDGYQPMGGYGQPVGVTVQVVEHGLRTGNGTITESTLRELALRK
jgi:hypothetical protein